MSRSDRDKSGCPRDERGPLQPLDHDERASGAARREDCDDVRRTSKSRTAEMARQPIGYWSGERSQLADAQPVVTDGITGR